MLFDKIIDDYNNKKKEFVKNTKNDVYSLVFDGDVVEIYSNGKKVMRAIYDTIGIYSTKTKYWIWSWNVDYLYFEKKVTDLKKSIETVLLKIKENSFKATEKEKEMMNYYFSNDSFYLTNLDLLIKIVLYFADGKWILTNKSDTSDNTEYILIKKIITVY